VCHVSISVVMATVHANSNTNANGGLKDHPPNPPRSMVREAAELLICTGLIYICYIGYAIIQEDVYKQRYGPEKRRFDHSLFLVFAQSVGNGLLAVVVLLYSRQLSSRVPMKEYFLISMSYIGAMFASTASLAYVTYPTQALAKSCKLIPVMLMRVFINRKRYELREYINVFLTTLGIAVFMMFQEDEGKKKGLDQNSWLGLALLFLSLSLDGYTSPQQEFLIERYHPFDFGNDVLHEFVCRGGPWPSVAGDGFNDPRDPVLFRISPAHRKNCYSRCAIRLWPNRHNSDAVPL